MPRPLLLVGCLLSLAGAQWTAPSCCQWGCRLPACTEDPPIWPPNVPPPIIPSCCQWGCRQLNICRLVIGPPIPMIEAAAPSPGSEQDGSIGAKCGGNCNKGICKGPVYYRPCSKGLTCQLRPGGGNVGKCVKKKRKEKKISKLGESCGKFCDCFGGTCGCMKSPPCAKGLTCKMSPGDLGGICVKKGAKRGETCQWSRGKYQKQGSCAEGLICSSTMLGTSLCIMREKTVGESCGRAGKDHGSCAMGLTCQYTIYSAHPGKCIKGKRAIGETCVGSPGPWRRTNDQGSCAKGLICSGHRADAPSICIKRKKTVGELCGNDRSCAEGLTCQNMVTWRGDMVSMKCAKRKKTIGESCGGYWKGNAPSKALYWMDQGSCEKELTCYNTPGVHDAPGKCVRKINFAI